MPHQNPLLKRPKPRTPAPKLREALAAALTNAGIQLPAMDVRTPWGDYVPDDGEQPAQDDIGVPASARHALVHLGVCSAPVALALAAVIAKGAAR